MATCSTLVGTRRKLFWTTQPRCKDATTTCGAACSDVGLVTYAPNLGTSEQKTFLTNDYAISMALNILMTNGRQPDSTCGRRPGTRGGHWSDSYRKGSAARETSGSLIRAVRPKGRVQDMVSDLRAYAQRDLNKLVSYGVAREVKVSVTYAGGGVVNLTAEIYGYSGELSRVGLTGTRSENEWIWQ